MKIFFYFESNTIIFACNKNLFACKHVMVNMENLMHQIKIRVNEKVYLKDPETSQLGKGIVQQSILMIDDLGLEDFTFKKLAKKLKTTESSIYRYFESKHRLLIYLTSWFWGWQEYRLAFSLANIDSPKSRLKKAIEIIAETVKQDSTFGHVNEEALHRIVISESIKAYMTKEVDAENKEGFFLAYKRLCHRISDIVKEVNPKYKYPSTLVSTMMESAHHQKYYAQHLPSLSDAGVSDKKIIEFLTDMVFKTLSK